MLGAIHSMLQQYGARLEIVFDGTNVVLSAQTATDYTDVELSQDYEAPLESSIARGEAYNHVIALGRGELTAREVVELWRLDNGNVTNTPQPNDAADKQFTLDYPNAESLEELTNNATAKLLENSPVESIKINLDEIDTDLKLGDVVGGWLLAKGALAAKTQMEAGDGDAAWLQGRLDLYEIYAANVLGHASSRLAAVGQGGELLQRMTLDVLSA